MQAYCMSVRDDASSGGETGRGKGGRVLFEEGVSVEELEGRRGVASERNVQPVPQPPAQYHAICRTYPRPVPRSLYQIPSLSTTDPPSVHALRLMYPCSVPRRTRYARPGHRVAAYAMAALDIG
eukprot:611318-Rhodomonas_salina.1